MCLVFFLCQSPILLHLWARITCVLGHVFSDVLSPLVFLVHVRWRCWSPSAVWLLRCSSQPLASSLPAWSASLKFSSTMCRHPRWVHSAEPSTRPLFTSNLYVCAGVCVSQQSYDILLLILMVLLLVQAILTSATVVHCASYKSHLRMASFDSDNRAHATKRYCEVRQDPKSHVTRWCSFVKSHTSLSDMPKTSLIISVCFSFCYSKYPAAPCKIMTRKKTGRPSWFRWPSEHAAPLIMMMMMMKMVNVGNHMGTKKKRQLHLIDKVEIFAHMIREIVLDFMFLFLYYKYDLGAKSNACVCWRASSIIGNVFYL